jgi:hypothetical protein
MVSRCYHQTCTDRRSAATMPVHAAEICAIACTHCSLYIMAADTSTADCSCTAMSNYSRQQTQVQHWICLRSLPQLLLHCNRTHCCLLSALLMPYAPGHVVRVEVVLGTCNLVGSSVHVTLLQQLAARHGREPAAAQNTVVRAQPAVANLTSIDSQLPAGPVTAGTATAKSRLC